MLFDGFKTPDVLRLDPGLSLETPDRPTGRRAGPELYCLLPGRAEDPELKGFDLGADAFANLPRSLRQNSRLIIRGAEPELGDPLQRRISEVHNINRSDCWVRPYDATAGAVTRDLLQATVLLMPSRGEGFGLVGIEALSVGTPVLVSARSGLAEHLQEIDKTLASRLIVEVNDDIDEDRRNWRRALEGVLQGPDEYFDVALSFWDRLNSRSSWVRSARSIAEAATRLIDVN